MADGEAFLSALLQLLFDRLASRNVLDFIRGHDIENDMKRLKKTLKKVNAVLNDAEDKQYKDEEVKMWMDELKDAAYDAEDVIDEFTTEEGLRQELKAESQTISNQVWSLLPNSFNSSVRSLGCRIKAITERFNDLENERSELGLKAVASRSSSTIRETSSVVDESIVYGRDNDKEKIIELLMKDEPRISVIPIVGMGGIGKTTLAQIVFNDGRLDRHFDKKAWTCVSEEFDVKGITKSILDSFGFTASDSNDLNQIQVKVRDALKGNKFLIVLDDVWSKKYGDWDILRSPFMVGAPGSKILVTTRIRDVASMMGTVDNYYLEHLSNNDCWSVFVQHAFMNRNFNTKPNLVEIGKKIVTRCKGLPLAVKTLGGLLRSKVEEDEWEEILNSEIWDLPEEENGILPALKLSYHHLPSHLKRCFAYSSIFPKDYEFQVEELVQLWMAEGLVQQPNRRKQMEDVGAKYFRDLLSRSFFQLSSSNKSWFVMHDLVNDLAQWVAGETCFRLDDTLEKQYRISRKTRYSSYVGSRYDGVKKFEAFKEFEYLRTFLPLKTPEWSYLTNYVPLNLLPKFRCLRVLSLGGYHITELPNSIGDLKHLRFLDLSHSLIRSLPESTSTLYNLQTLILKDCHRLKKLPTTMGNLINLRYLDIVNANSIEEMPQGVGKLMSLRKLSNFIVGNNGGSRIGELMNLKCLMGTLFISRLENVADDRDAREANLKDKQGLDLLTMEWSFDFNASRNEGLEIVVLEMLQPHEKLKELTIKCYGGTRFPMWIEDPSFSNMVLLRLENCVKCTSLPSLGQLPLLKDLWIEGMNKVNSVGLEFYGNGCPKPFQSLETLSFVEMHNWEDWLFSEVDRQVEAFPCLRELSIEGCPKLSGKLPIQLPSMEKLIIRRCQQLSVSILSLPKLYKLDIRDCKGVEHSTVGLGSLKTISLLNISKPICLTQGFMQGSTQVEDLSIDGCRVMTSLWQGEAGVLRHLTSLRHLTIRSCPEFVCLVAEEKEEEQQQQLLGLSCGVESLRLYNCINLEKLQGFHSFTSLRKLTISGCPRLASFLETSFPSMLRELTFQRCTALKSIHRAMLLCCKNGCLEFLCIEMCNSLIFIARGQLPSTLKKLKIQNCENLQSLVAEEESSTTTSLHKLSNNNNPSLLEYLYIYGCSSLTSLSSRGELPTTLKCLDIGSCPRLESIAERFHNDTSLEHIQIYTCGSLKSLPKGLHNLNHLCSFNIRWCPNLISFPDGGLPAMNLRELWIFSCEMLKSLPHRMHNLYSLRELRIFGCPRIASFPKEGFSTNLTSLHIGEPSICKAVFEWGLHRLVSLRELDIYGPCPNVVSFPEEGKGMILPTSLTTLSIRKFPNLEYLSSKGFQNLTSLTRLTIEDFPNLEYLSSNGLQNLSSLEFLWIDDCPKLKSFLEEELPPSLLQLHIYNCPLLKQRCRKNRGRDWPKIAHIPYVYIDGWFIFNLEEE